ncbi:MAG: hypothetical protein OXN97_25210 [Bryobacterales bacterium]|nr:hypothetical protein [Bryobacterales bacterium]
MRHRVPALPPQVAETGQDPLAALQIDAHTGVGGSLGHALARPDLDLLGVHAEDRQGGFGGAKVEQLQFPEDDVDGVLQDGLGHGNPHAAKGAADPLDGA